MTEGDLVASTSRALAQSIERFVARVAAQAPIKPDVGSAFARALVKETASDLARAIDGFVARVVADSPQASPEPVTRGFANLVLAPARVVAVMAQTAEHCGLSQRETDVLTASLCGIPRRHLGRVLGVGEHTIKTTVRHAIQKTGHQNLDDAVWWLRMQSGEARRSSGERRGDVSARLPRAAPW